MRIVIELKTVYIQFSQYILFQSSYSENSLLF